MQRVFISGVGLVCPLGNDRKTVWRQLLAGQSGVAQLTQIDVSDLEVKIGGEVRNFDPKIVEVNERTAARKKDRASLFAVAAALQALDEAGLAEHSLGRNGAVVVGAGLSGLLTLQEQTENLLRGGPRKVSPMTIPLLMPNAAAANICIATGFKGPAYTVSSACASSGHAMIDAARLIACGEADVVITGGTEASLTRLGMASFINMRAMAKGFNDNPTAAVRPFDRERSGLIMSEGAGCLIFESESHLRQRGAKAYAEFLGRGVTSDAYHITQPDPGACEAGRSVAECLQNSRLLPDEIADRIYVNAHGTSTKFNDAAETLALKAGFGTAAERLRISSTKSMSGHLIGAAAGLEMAICCMALVDRQLPPTINLKNPDPECDLNYLPGSGSVQADIDYAMNVSFGFGGHNVCLMIGRGNDPSLIRDSVA